MTPTDASGQISPDSTDSTARMVLIAICTAASMVVAPPRLAATRGQLGGTGVVSTGRVPRDGYKTWSLFLVCNPAWATSEREQDLAKLYESFKAFGDAIGDHNLAVWFSSRGTLRTSSPELDAARSARYCRTLQLKPSLGPYIVITASYPDEAGKPNERAVFQLGGLGPTEIGGLLGKLADDLLLTDTVPRPTTQNAPVAGTAAATGPDSTAKTTAASSSAPSLWIRLLEGAQRNMIGFGCRVELAYHHRAPQCRRYANARSHRHRKAHSTSGLGQGRVAVGVGWCCCCSPLDRFLNAADRASAVVHHRRRTCRNSARSLRADMGVARLKGVAKFVTSGRVLFTDSACGAKPGSDRGAVLLLAARDRRYGEAWRRSHSRVCSARAAAARSSRSCRAGHSTM